MKKYIFAVVVFLFAGCASVVTKQSVLRSDAHDLFAQGQYHEAWQLYQQLLSQPVQFPLSAPDSLLFRNAAITASKIGIYSEAARRGVQVATSSDTLLLSALVLSLDSVNRSSEATFYMSQNIPYFASLIPQGYISSDSLYTRLSRHFLIDSSPAVIGVFCNATPLFQSQNFKAYFTIAKRNLKPAELSKACLSMLKIDGSNPTALRYLATEDFDQAESQYKSAMTEYNKNQNATTYAYLRRDLKKISKLYVSAKDRLELLRRNGSAENADLKRLVVSYQRLDQNAKAESIKKLIK